MYTQKRIKIFLIEDDPVILESLRLLLGRQKDFQVLGVAKTARDGINQLKIFTPDIVLVDVGLPDKSGVEVIPEIKNVCPDADVVMLTIHQDQDVVFASFRNGAIGYILKGDAPEKLFQDIRNVVNGGASISPSIAKKIIKSFRHEEELPLTQRELEVLSLVSNGNNNNQIASKLFVSANTIKAHIKNIYKKLEVRSRAEAVKVALKKGYIN